jgi:hypothetical protein
MIVRNVSDNNVHCGISTEADNVGAIPNHTTEWVAINSKASLQPQIPDDLTFNTGWRLIAFKNAEDSERGGVYLDLSEPKLVEFHDFDKILVF